MDIEIPKAQELAARVFSIHNEKDFESIALGIYQFQYDNNPLYQSFCNNLGKTPVDVRNLEGIPFLPISFFKSHEVKTTNFSPELIFRSSGTTGMQTSRHLVKEAALYRKSYLEGFRLYFGDPAAYCILGLLPSYLERNDSSLVYMVDGLIKESRHPESGFYLYDYKKLSDTLDQLEAAGQPVLLFGVSFALLDFIEAFPKQLKHTRVVETGGMKGRKKEITREELYQQLKSGLGTDIIYSEYGMTELLSQAYGANGNLSLPPWMRIFLRDETDPLQLLPDRKGQAGVINIIDLANLYSCSFIATEDLGRREEKGFQVLGRLDHADIRGCSQLVL